LTIQLPGAGPADADPQVDPTSGQAFVFRDKTIFVIDPAAGTVTRAVTVSVPSTVDTPITRSFYDLVNHKLYVALVTYVSTPWVQFTIVSYDADTLTELGHYKTEANFHAVPFLDSLYGTTASRLGRYVSWAWNGSAVWFEEGFSGAIRPQGIVADWGRQLVYEALHGKIRVIKAFPRAMMGEVESAPLAGDGHLAGHDPISDQLYFLVNGQLVVQPTADILTPPAEEPGAETPYCRPSEASIDLSASDSSLQVGQAVTITVTLANGDSSSAKLGQILYRLEVQPAAAFSSQDWGPVESTLTLEPGQSDAVQFVLQAETSGPARLTGSASYEMHAMDYSWGSWSGCHSRKLEISVRN
jgi:hypothetical protein